MNTLKFIIIINFAITLLNHLRIKIMNKRLNDVNVVIYRFHKNDVIFDKNKGKWEIKK